MEDDKMFSKSISSVSRREVLRLLVVSGMCLVASDVSSAGDFGHEPESVEYVPRNKVRLVQNRLKELGFDPGPIDGLYGPKTEKAIMEFQRSKNMKVDGKIVSVNEYLEN
jgi:hypothetical protein